MCHAPRLASSTTWNWNSGWYAIPSHPHHHHHPNPNLYPCPHPHTHTNSLRFGTAARISAHICIKYLIKPDSCVFLISDFQTHNPRFGLVFLCRIQISVARRTAVSTCRVQRISKVLQSKTISLSSHRPKPTEPYTGSTPNCPGAQLDTDPPHIPIPLHIPISNPVIRKPLPTRSRSRNRLAVELRKRQPKKKPGIMPTITEDCIDGFQQYYSRPPERPKKKSLKQMVYDSEDNSYFGRSMDSWGELEIFHCGLRKPQVLAPVASSRVDSLDKSLTLIKRISFVVALALTADADYRGCGWVEWMDGWMYLFAGLPPLSPLSSSCPCPFLLPAQ